MPARYASPPRIVHRAPLPPSISDAHDARANTLARDLGLTLNPAPVRAQQVRGQTPKVAKQDKKKVPKGRAGKRIKVSVASSRHARLPASSSPRKKLDAFVWFSSGIWRPAAPLRGRRSRMQAVNRPANVCDRHIGAFGGAGLLDLTLPTRQPRRSLAPTTHGVFRVFSLTTNPDRFLPRPAPSTVQPPFRERRRRPG